MYSNKLVASIRANSKILREFKDTVYIPFGSEYSIVLKNLNTVRAIVNITLDGTDVCPGGLVLMAGQTIDLERWIKNGNLSAGNKFKFIERTAQIEAHKGIGIEDGIINITYQFEQPQIRNATTIWDHNTGHWEKEEKWKYVYGNQNIQNTGILRGLNSPMGGGSWLSASGAATNISNAVGGASFASVNQANLSNIKVTAQSEASFSDKADGGVYNDAGITVAGSKSEQKFATASWFPVLPEKHSIVLKLLGETPDNKPIVKAVTVKAKPKCTSCGKMNKANAKFCTECGTALEIFA
jgi:hypothetical protein